MLSSVLAGLALAVASPQVQPDCVWSDEGFDQLDLAEYRRTGPYRDLYRSGCFREAARANARYLELHERTLDDRAMTQMLGAKVTAYLFADDEEAAAQPARRLVDLYRDDPVNGALVRANLALIERDREALLAVRDSLADIPVPEPLKERIDQIEAESGERIWPLHLPAVNLMLECFEDGAAAMHRGDCEAARIPETALP